jgi:long-subunit acyl-CoA synthetase (AMP-forming)
MVIGGKDKDYVSAIINIDFAMVGKWAERHRIPYTTFVDLSQKKEVADLVRDRFVGEALTILRHSEKRKASAVVEKTLRSAIANAQNKVPRSTSTTFMSPGSSSTRGPNSSGSGRRPRDGPTSTSGIG